VLVLFAVFACVYVDTGLWAVEMLKLIIIIIIITIIVLM
jgi:hypothetical protein